MLRNSRVLLLIDQLGPGGAERQLTYLASQLSNRSCEVRLLYFYPHDVFYSDILTKSGIKTECFERAKNRIKRPFALAKEIRRWKPDAVIAYLDGTVMGACLARILIKFNLIVSERNTTQSLTFRDRIKFNLYRIADSVVCNSFSQAEFIHQYYPNLKHKLHVITNMVDTDIFTPIIKYHKEKSQRSIPRVITTARIARQKNVFRYLDAIAILRDKGINVHFDWFGTPEDNEYLSAVLSHKDILNLNDYITFHIGGSKDIVSEYRQSSHFCLPSLYEGFPNVLCEAMSCGLICTASDVCDNPSILADSSRRFDPTSVVNIADTIAKSLQISDSEEDYEGTLNRKMILKLCSPETFTNKYLSLIEN